MLAIDSRVTPTALVTAVGGDQNRPKDEKDLRAAFEYLLRPYEALHAPIFEPTPHGKHLEALHPLLYVSALWLQRYWKKQQLPPVVTPDELPKILAKAKSAFGSFLVGWNIPHLQESHRLDIVHDTYVRETHFDDEVGFGCVQHVCISVLVRKGAC
jgi:hypothetical protein